MNVNLIGWSLGCLFFLAACTAQAENSLDGLAFEVDAQIIGDYLELSAFIVNESATNRDIEFSFCALNVTAYSSDERTTPVWDGIIDERSCAEPLFFKTLAPGERWTTPEFLERYEVAKVPLEEGGYLFTVSINLNGTETAAFSAGEVYLDTDFEPLTESP